MDEKAGGRQQKSCGGGQEIIGLGGRGSSIVRRKLAFFWRRNLIYLCRNSVDVPDQLHDRAEPFKPVKPPKIARVVILKRVNTLDKAIVH